MTNPTEEQLRELRDVLDEIVGLVLAAEPGASDKITDLIQSYATNLAVSEVSKLRQTTLNTISAVILVPDEQQKEAAKRGLQDIYNSANDTITNLKRGKE